MTIITLHNYLVVDITMMNVLFKYLYKIWVFVLLDVLYIKHGPIVSDLV